jgi:carboxypeptidase family protein
MKTSSMMTRLLAGAGVCRTVALFLVLIPALAAAQVVTGGRLAITVVDQTDAVIPGAKVTVTRIDGPEPRPTRSEESNQQGIATITGLGPGRYSVRAEFPGFENGSVPDVRVRAGDNRHRIALAIQKVEDTVTVGQDPDRAAADPRGPAFGTALTREQIDALSEDPDELKRQLQEIAGPGAVFRVDSFEGAQLPPKSQIRMIRISRDAFAAENHFSEGLQIDIVTQPGIGPIRGNVSSRIRDGSLTGRSPFVEKKGPERSQDYSMGLSGSLARNRTSFNMNLGGVTSFITPNLNAALVSGTRAEALSVRRPTDQWNVNANVDHALTKDQTLRLGFNRNSRSTENLGIGDYDLPERAFETESTNYNLRLQHVGPLGRRFFINTRTSVSWSDSATHSALEAPTIRVLDAFTSGGQQLAGGTRTRGAFVASDLDYVRGIHSVRMGITLENAWYRSDSTSNYLGTYTFENLAAYAANKPRSYTRRIGDPRIDYFNLQGGLYVQDDIRVRRNLTLSPGVRYEAQTHVSDYNNVGPRFGVTWSPGTSGKTSYRFSTGLFYDWLGTGTYEQTVRVDGSHQQELNIADPLYPDPGSIGVVPPLNRYLLGDDVRMPRRVRFTGGVDRRLSRQSRIGITWTHLTGASLQRGENLNAPVEGLRPFPEFGNVIQVVSDARVRQNNATVFFNTSFNRPPPAPPRPQSGGQGGAAAAPAPPPQALPGLPGAQNQRLIDWRRMSITSQYIAGWVRNNTDGDFSVPATGRLDREWSTAPGDVRHRFILQWSAQFVRNLTTSLLANATSGSPYTLLTGFDDNGDLIFNDRPAGVPRNTERTKGQLSLNGNINYSFTFGRANPATPPQTGISITSINGVASAQTISVPQAGRYRVSLYAQIQNLTNRANYVGYSGVMTSKFFLQPRDVANPRRVDIGINFGW